MKKLISILCSVTLLAGMTAFTGCKNNAEESNSISVAIMAPDVIASEGTAENNRWTEYIKEGTGLDIKWVAIPQADMKTKLPH
ncbi:MAG: hypothetical protein UH081_07585 [Clostridia bacterium]|nr:hypothetical protein [Clostridia bacterium]